MKKIYLLLIFICVFATHSFAQQKDSTWVGTADGVLFDSAYNYVLQSATVAVYFAKDSALVNYQLSDNFGAFHFKGLPLDIPLRLIASYTGYKNFVKTFTIPKTGKKIDLKTVNLDRKTDELEEVVVQSVPPVRMNGDTLEFNADAFHLDKNAVAEDLLRRLPGITVWGDGSITVNGKEVASVMVDGKPFFGGDTKVATQNIAKGAIDKIQVYQQAKDRNNPLDSTTQVNIKLKADKNFGGFGKVGGGYGSRKRYEVDGNMNLFNSKTQMGIVAASNNTNKVANDANTLMRNSTYKGVGASIEYQPNFRAQGISQPNAAGITFQHDFIPNADYLHNNRLTANYFANNNNTKTSRNTSTLTDLGGDSSLTQLSNSETRSGSTVQRFNGNYEFRKDQRSLTVTPSFNLNNTYSHSKSNSDATGSLSGAQSINDAQNDSYGNSKDIALKTHFTNGATQFGGEQRKNLFRNFQADYNFNAGSNDNEQHQRSNFVSYLNPSQNQKVDRKYNNSSNDMGHNIILNFNDIQQFISNHYNALRDIRLALKNNLVLNTHKENNSVSDLDTITGNYMNNNYLTNISKYTTVNDIAGLGLQKYFFKSLANRYNKMAILNITPQWQFYRQQNESLHDFQDFRHSYRRFVPSASISYQNYQYGDYNDNFSLKFDVTSDYPSVQQLFPLVDSANLYNIQLGNPNLKPYDRKNISFNFSHSSQRTRNTFNYNFTISAGTVSNSIVDSSIIAADGRTTHYAVNADGDRYANASGQLNKAFKFKHSELQLNINTSFNLSRNPNYVNNTLNISNSFSNNHTVGLNYTRGDHWAVNLSQNLSFYNSVQKGFNDNTFKNTSQATTLSTSVNITKKLTVNSNAAYNHYTSSGSDATNFTIWNASAAYRFFSGNNAELKFSALDLLHQNTSILNYGSNNSLTRGTVNVLQQYFMVTFSYFPRKFGNKKKEE